MSCDAQMIPSIGIMYIFLKSMGANLTEPTFGKCAFFSKCYLVRTQVYVSFMQIKTGQLN